MLKTEKIIRLRNQKKGRSLEVVREHYVRDDVPCYSSVCLADCRRLQEAKLCMLPRDVTHYIVPDCEVARDYHELLEFPELRGVLFMQTVINSAQQEGGRKVQKKLNNLIKDARKQSIVFYNEFQRYSYCPRQPGENLDTWQTRSVYEGAVWYYDHLAGQMPIIILTVNTEAYTEIKGQTEGVFILHIEEYLKKFWPDMTSAILLFESLSVSLAQTGGKGGQLDYQGYLPAELLQSGLQSGHLIQGLLQVNRYNAQNDATVRRTGMSSKDVSSTQDVFISGAAGRNRAVHGDQVVVELLPKTQWRSSANTLPGTEQEDGSEGSGPSQPTGKIVGVTQRNWRDYVVTLQQEEESPGLTKKTGRILVVPMDRRIPKIRISTRQIDLLKDKRFVVRIDSWEVGSQYPNGHFVSVLGPIGDLETELKALLLEHQLSVSAFSKAQLCELPSNSADSPWCVDEAEVNQRRDLRSSHVVFSIDPRGCEDVDDTLSVRELESCGLELGVHIADVTYFVPYNTLTDLEARARSTTVYLADRRFDMLPEVLSADLCSLISGVDRYAMSVLWTLDENYEVTDVWYGRTVISSSYKLFYEFAQQLSEADPEDLLQMADSVPELTNLTADQKTQRLTSLQWYVKKLMEVSRHLKAKRSLGGALELESTEVAVQMAESKEIKDLIPKQSLEIHETIAECMIFANHWVAKRICQAFPSHALLRHHPLPRQEQFAELLRCAAAQGFTIDTRSNKTLADSLDLCVDPHDPTVNKVLRSLATMAMSNAAYMSTGSVARHEYFHYGLALDFYTHFTSPIRRYADVIVHRLLLAALGREKEENLFSNKQLDELAAHMNKKHRSSQHAQRDSVELFQALYFKGRSEEDEVCIVDAIVIQLRANGLMVYIPRYGIKGAVYLKKKEGLVAYVGQSGRAEWSPGGLTSADQEVCVTTTSGRQTYTLLMHVTVAISVQESHTHSASIKLTLRNNQGHEVTSLTHDAKQQKSEIIREVTSAAAEPPGASDEDLISLGPQFAQWRAEFGQTDPARSFYHTVQSLRDMALLDV